MLLYFEKKRPKKKRERNILESINWY